MTTYSIILGMVGIWQILLIVFLVVLLFGGKKLPELMRGMGSGIREFKDGMQGDERKPADKNDPNSPS